jgi:hypothetical protein
MWQLAAPEGAGASKTWGKVDGLGPARLEQGGSAATWGGGGRIRLRDGVHVSGAG